LKHKSVRRLSFIADENFSTRLVEILRIFSGPGAGISITSVEAEFGKGTRDEDWLLRLSERTPRPAVLGGDGRILSNPARLEALKVARVHFFLFAKGYTNLEWREQVIKTLTLWGKICKLADKHRDPTLFNVKTGKSMNVDILGPLADYECHQITKRTMPGQERIA